MTSEEKVKAVYPRARAQRYRTNGPGGRGYYLVWSLGPYSSGTRRLGEGKTASSAWVDAATNLQHNSQLSRTGAGDDDVE